MILLFRSIFADVTDIKTIISLVIASAAIALLFTSKKIAAKIIEKKYPVMDRESSEYKEKLLDKTLIFKYTAAGLAVAASILSLL